MRLAMVEWVDSSCRHGWQDREDRRLLYCISVGIVTKETDEMIAIVESIGDHGKGEFQNEMTIPRVAIKRMRRLAVVKDSLITKV